MLLAECPSCRNWQTIKKRTCNKCGHVFRSRLVYITRICVPRGEGKYSYHAERHPGKSLDEVRQIELQQKMEQKTFGPPPEVLTLSALFELYNGFMDIKNPRWAVECRRILAETVAYFGDIPAAKLTRTMILGFRTALSFRPNKNKWGTLSNRTVNTYMAVGRAAFNYVDPGGHNPYRALGRLPEAPVVEYLTEAEEERLLLVAKTRMPIVWRFIVVSLATGFRRSEVLNLRRSEVDFESKIISTKQKGGKVTHKPLTKMGEAILKSIPEDGTDFFFYNFDTCKPYIDLKAGFKKCLALAGITKPFRQHGLRHHVAYKLLKSSRNLKLVQEVLGHAQIQTTTRYLTMLPDEIRDQTACLDIPGVMGGLVSDSTESNVVSLRKQ